MKTTTLTLSLLVLLIGCSPKEAVTKGTGDSSGTSSTAAKESPEVKPVASDVPASLKHAAYEYYGLGNPKTMDMVLKSPNGPDKTGGVSTQLEKIEGESATYKIVRSGAIAGDLGDETMVVEPSGIYMVGTSMGTISPEKFLALPADLTVGKTWTQKTKVTRNDGQEVEENSTYKVEGERSLTTKAGTQTALLVSSSGTASVSSGATKQTSKHVTKYWYVKGVGSVKVEITLNTPGMPPRTLIVEQTK